MAVAAGACAPRQARRRLPLRAWIIQGGLLLALAALVLFIAGNVAANVARLNVRTGFAFLARPAGFDIAQRLIDYGENATYFDAFLVALVNTVVLAGISAGLATVLGFLVGLARLSTNRLLALVAAGYVEIVRNIPLLLQLFFWYFAVLGALPLPRQSLAFLALAFLNKRGLFLPAPVMAEGAPLFAALAAAGIALSVALWLVARRRRIERGTPSPLARLALVPAPLAVFVAWLLAGAPLTWDLPVLQGFNFSGGIVINPEFVAMIVALTIYGSAFIGELVRGGIQSVPRGQSEAGRALGLPGWRIATMIVMPQAMRAIVPPLAGQYISILKNSSLGAAIAYPDLMLIFAGTALNQTGQPLETMAITMATYLALCLTIAAGAAIVNRRVQLVER